MSKYAVFHEKKVGEALPGSEGEEDVRYPSPIWLPGWAPRNFSCAHLLHALRQKWLRVNEAVRVQFGGADPWMSRFPDFGRSGNVWRRCAFINRCIVQIWGKSFCFFAFSNDSACARHKLNRETDFDRFPVCVHICYWAYSCKRLLFRVSGNLLWKHSFATNQLAYLTPEEDWLEHSYPQQKTWNKCTRVSLETKKYCDPT